MVNSRQTCQSKMSESDAGISRVDALPIGIWSLFFILSILHYALSITPAYAQTRFSLKPLSLPITANNQMLTLLNAGGINAGQFSGGDIDKDGRYDILIFDREAERTLILTREANGTIIHNLTLEARVPRIKDWALLRDYDGDGRPDFFCGRDDNVWLYRNEADVNGNATFVLKSSQLISTSLAGGPLPVTVARSDIPDIVDMDGDGDLDIISFEFFGSTVNLHRNTSVERLGNRQGFEFVKSGCWGRFAESSSQCGSYTLNISCRLGVEPPMPAGPQHAGSTLQVRDADGDGDPDLLVSDVDCSDLNLLFNDGSLQSPVIGRVQASYPQNTTAARFRVFPAGFSLDFDQDGQLDLIAAPNVQSNADAPPVNFQASAWRYRGMPGNALQFIDSADWQRQMGDLGAHAAPCAYDVDGDGLQDLVVGADNYYESRAVSSRAHFFRNTGTGYLVTALPLFDQVRQASNEPLIPVVSDFNADGLVDLGFVTTAAGGATQIVYFAGLAAPAGGLAIATVLLISSIALRAGDVPAFFDADFDGDADMLLGKNRGQLQFYRNDQGNYTLVSGSYLGYSFATNRPFVHPAVADFDGNGSPDVLLYDGRGQLRYYADPVFADGYRAAPDTSLWQLGGDYQPLNMGQYVTLAAAQLTADSLPDLVIGMGGGGLRLAENALRRPLSTRTILQKQMLFQVQGNRAKWLHTSRYVLMNLQGQVLRQGVGEKGTRLEVAKLNLPTGCYLLKATTDNGHMQAERWLAGE